MKKRSDWDFTEFTHKRTIYKNEEDKEIIVDTLKKGNSRNGYLRFVNDEEGLSVYGDFGNWIFNRPFVPSPEGSVLDGYWVEKLRMASQQEISTYDPTETAKEIEELIKSGLEEYGYEGDELKKIKEWFDDLLYYVDDEIEYKYHAYRDCISDIDYDMIPFRKEFPIWLSIVFDGFEFICQKMKENELTETN